MATKTFKIGLSNTDKQNMAQDILEQVEDMLFAEYDSGETYNEGDYCVYSSVLYRCKEDSVTGTWDATKWETATLQDLVDDVNDAVDSVQGKANISDLEDGSLVVNKALSAISIQAVSEESGSEQHEPFLYQATGTDGYRGYTDTSPVAKHLQLRGNSVAFNQLMKNGNFADNSGFSGNSGSGDFSTISIANNILTQTFNSTPDAAYKSGFVTDYGYRPNILKNHYYLVKFKFKATKNCSVQVYTAGTGYFASQSVVANTWTYYYAIKQATSTELATNLASNITDARILENDDVLEWAEFQLFDLTLMGLDDIDDYTYPDKDGNTVTISKFAVFNSLYPLPYYSYNVGQMFDCDSSKLVTIGYNQFDGVFESGGIDNDGTENSDNRFERSENFIKVIAGQKYSLEQSGGINSVSSAQRIIFEYDGANNVIKRTLKYNTNNEFLSPVIFTLQNNTQFVRIVYYDNTHTFDIQNVCFHLTWDESSTGYEEYEKHEYNLPTLAEPLRSADNVYDEYNADGSVIRRVGYVDSIASLLTTQTPSASGVIQITVTSLGIKANDSYSYIPNITCARYKSASFSNVYNAQVKKSIGFINNVLAIQDDDFIGKTTAQIITLLTDVGMRFELDTPITSQETPFTENIEVSDFGTMEFVPTATESASRPIIPQGNKFFYPADYVLLVDSLNNYVNGDVTDLAKKSDLEFEELDSSYIGSITSTQIVSGAFFKNEIAISGGLTNAKYVCALMSNGNIYPMAITSSSIVCFNGINFQSGSVTVSKIYYKE